MIAPRISQSLYPPQTALLTEIAAHLTVLGDSGYDRPAVKRDTHVLAELAKNEEIVNLIVEGGIVPALVKHLVSPSCMQGDRSRSVLLQLEHEVEKGCAFALGLLDVKDISLDNVSRMYELSVPSH